MVIFLDNFRNDTPRISYKRQSDRFIALVQCIITPAFKFFRWWPAFLTYLSCHFPDSRSVAESSTGIKPVGYTNANEGIQVCLRYATASRNNLLWCQFSKLRRQFDLSREYSFNAFYLNTNWRVRRRESPSYIPFLVGLFCSRERFLALKTAISWAHHTSLIL